MLFFQGPVRLVPQCLSVLTSREVQCNKHNTNFPAPDHNLQSCISGENWRKLPRTKVYPKEHYKELSYNSSHANLHVVLLSSKYVPFSFPLPQYLEITNNRAVLHIPLTALLAATKNPYFKDSKLRSLCFNI